MTASAKPVTTVGIDLSDTFLALCKKDPHVLTRLFGQSVVPASKENAASSMTRSSGTPTFYTIKINEK
ncbi:MAG: hypothetical protein H0X51_00630 [Parachlamydiaceae bacterium]|nr:hypothetical protein [Parachlamydiaceae bacterium]